MTRSRGAGSAVRARQVARAKYAALVVGRPGWGALLKYELVVMLAQARPGALGLALRKTLYPWLLGSCGRNVIFGQNVVLRHPHKIHIGDNVVIDDNCLLDAKGESNRGIRIGSGVFIGRNTILSCKNGDIELADGANIGFNCELFSASRVTVGKDVLMAAYSYVIGGDHDFSDPSAAVLAQSRTSAGVTIGDGAWLGAGAKISTASRSASTRSSARAPSSATTSSRTPSPSAFRRGSSHHESRRRTADMWWLRRRWRI